jgi:hypothetical protein
MLVGGNMEKMFNEYFRIIGNYNKTMKKHNQLTKALIDELDFADMEVRAFECAMKVGAYGEEVKAVVRDQ